MLVVIRAGRATIRAGQHDNPTTPSELVRSQYRAPSSTCGYMIVTGPLGLYRGYASEGPQTDA